MKTISRAEQDKLMRAMQGGDVVALAELWFALKPRIMGVVTKILWSYCELDHFGVAYSVLWRIWQHKDRFEFKCQVSSWVHVLTVNECRMFLRNMQRDKSRALLAPENVDDYADTIACRHIDADRQIDVKNALATVLKFAAERPDWGAPAVAVGAGLTAKEAAAAIGRTVPSTKSSIFRFRNFHPQARRAYLKAIK